MNLVMIHLKNILSMIRVKKKQKQGPKGAFHFGLLQMRLARPIFILSVSMFHLNISEGHFAERVSRLAN